MGGLALPAVVYALATVVLTWPVMRGLGQHVFGSGLLLADLHLVAWILAWVAHTLCTHPTRLFEANAFYPTPHVLAGSETLLGDQLFFLPVWLATGNPALGMNVVLLAGFFLSGLCMHVLVRRWTGSTVAAYVAGLAYAAAPWRLDVGRVHLLSAQYLPLVLLTLERAATRARLRDGALAAGVLTLQVLCSYYVGYAAYVLAGAWVVAELAVRGVRGRGAAWRALAVALVGPAIVLVPLSLPYLRLKSAGALGYEPWPVPPEALALVSPFITRVVGGDYVGWGTLGLGVVGLVALGRRWNADPVVRVRVVALVLAALAGFALAHGSAGLVWGAFTPYEWLRRIVPGFANLRSALRFGTVPSCAVAVLAGFGVAGLAARAATQARRATLAAAGALLVTFPALRSAPIVGWPVATPGHVPAAYDWLREHGEGAPLLELPIGPALGPQQNLFAATAMYHSIYHWLPLLNGHTGYQPPAYPLLEHHAGELPSAEALAFLVDCTGLRWILVHQPPPTRSRLWELLPSVQLRMRFPHVRADKAHEDLLYEVRAPLAGACRAHLFERDVTAMGNPLGTPDPIRGVVAVGPTPEVLVAGIESRFTVHLENAGTVLWPNTSVDPARRVVITVRWLALDGGDAPRDQYLLVPADLAPGARFDFAAWVRHPLRPGGYRLQLFANVLGGTPLASATRDVTMRALLPAGR